jgi:hypothetical protein
MPALVEKNRVRHFFFLLSLTQPERDPSNGLASVGKNSNVLRPLLSNFHGEVEQREPPLYASAKEWKHCRLLIAFPINVRTS